ncbi:MAG: DUF1624 domain-containing protein [Oscillospiraceae bacterium]|nr:DUF1624 domain-containing protein [Oscillospiraceae bacterium]
MRETKRIGLLDEIRGFAIICMVVYHFMFSLNNFYNVDVPIFFEDWFGVIRNIFAGAFIFISGCVCRFSRNNLKRGVQCFFLGMLITFVVAFAQPDFPIYFGVLHLLGISMIIFALSEPFFDFVPPLAGIIIFGFLFFFLFNVPHITYADRMVQNYGYIGFKGFFEVYLPDTLYKTAVLFPLGFPKAWSNFSDYFPLIPWFFLFGAGSFFGVYVRENALPRWFYKTRVGFLAATGRHTIWIYLLHQPIIIAILNFVFKD